MKIRNVDSVAREIPGVTVVAPGAEIEVSDELGHTLTSQPWFDEATPPARERAARRPSTADTNE